MAVTITQREKDFLISLMKTSFEDLKFRITRQQERIAAFNATEYDNQFQEATMNMTASEYSEKLNTELTGLQNLRDRYIKLRDWIIASNLTSP